MNLNPFWKTTDQRLVLFDSPGLCATDTYGKDLLWSGVGFYALKYVIVVTWALTHNHLPDTLTCIKS